MAYVEAETRQPGLPPLTRNLDQAAQDIKDYGICLVDGVLEGKELARVRDALYRAAEHDKTRGREQQFSLDYEEDGTNQRIWNVLSRDPVFEDLVTHPAALELVKSVIGWPCLLGNISANITAPGGGEMVLHADQIFVPEPWPAEPQGVNVVWCVDEFTEENGGTRFAPGSHLLHRLPREDEASTPTTPIEAPAGAIAVFESRVWHKTGFNRTKDQRRAGIFAWYTKPIYRQQENWYLSLQPSVRQFASEEMLVLLGLKTEGLGLVNGASPA